MGTRFDHEFREGALGRDTGAGWDAAGLSAGARRALLACGAVAGPLYVGVGAVEAILRPGYDIRRHPLSLLANGEWGWVHGAMMMSTGALTVAGALGMRGALAPGRGATWGPRLVGLYGLGVLAAGLFRADPALGFPPGTPVDQDAVSTSGILHFVGGGIGFGGLIAACLVFARRFAAEGERGWAVYSAATGVLFTAAFVGISAGAQLGGAALTFVLLAFTAAVILGWAWITALAARLLRQRPSWGAE